MNLPDTPDELKRIILEDVSKCLYCGFCEWICPTLNLRDTMRNHGPRGRVSIMMLVLKNGLWTKTGFEGIYSCLLCQACDIECPAGVHIERDIRLFRHYINIKNMFL